FKSTAGKDKNFVSTSSVPEFLGMLEHPRKIIMLIRPGKPVDDFIKQMEAHLSPGDILIDAGNSFYRDTQRRATALKKQGIEYVGLGISGGEEGAFFGPSLMAGCSDKAWKELKELLTGIAAVADGKSCCARVGTDGAGHFVKMIHNGIEYADMQIIAEAYAYMRDGLQMTPDEMSRAFERWNTTPELGSYLIGITANILKKKDADTGNYLVDMILDTAGQKGTGKWTSEAAFDLSVSTPTIAEAVFSRIVSALKEERMEAYELLPGCEVKELGRVSRTQELEKLKHAVTAAKLCVFAQGFSLITTAAKSFGWKIDPAEIADIWQGGCIIRAAMLTDIAKAYRQDPKLENLLLSPVFRNLLASVNSDWRNIASYCIRSNIAIPAISSTIAYYD
ncbi:MAG: NADP-dependent phosphogluconate dehydrogenase, partial [Lentisphaeria bacterium]|nr:NADP-dependent phosphogluconate dehydrogenase [Lentisphaeria bacterium]